MKLFYQLLITPFLFCLSTWSNAQNIVEYQFENPPGTNPTTNPTFVATGITVNSIVGSGITNIGASHPGSVNGNPDETNYAFRAAGWPTGNALDPAKYLEFTVNANSGCSFIVTGLQVGANRVDNGSDPGFFELRSSYDTFASSLNSEASGSVSIVDGNFSASSYTATGNASPPSPFGVAGLTSLTFRGYYYGTASLTRIDQVSLVGQVSCVMPVEFTSFVGKAIGNRVQLSWETSWERNADRFEIQRSQDAAEFESIGQVKAVGDANQKQTYGFTDEVAQRGINYYRLRQIDRNGSVQLSNIIAVTTRPDMPGIAVLGNPIDGKRIKLQLFNVDIANLQLIDIRGHLVDFRVVESGGGIVSLEATNSLNKGIYLVRATNLSAVKIVVQ